MSVTYNALEGDLTVRSIGTATRSGDSDGVALVGGYDSNNADNSVSVNSATLVSDPNNADSLFGDSELARAAKAASSNGVDEIYGVPLSETQTTESFTATQSMALSNTPLFDPSVHPDHDITVTDSSTSDDLTVNIVYADSPSTPSDADTANVNPINGKVEVDASSDYDVQYTYCGDYQSAISEAALQDVRYLYVGTEADSVKTTAINEMADVANDFDFKRVFTGATPEIQSGSISSYTPNQTNWRLVEVAPARATGADGEVRTGAAIAGFMATQPIGPDGSGLYDDVQGLTDLNVNYRPSNARNFTQVTSLTRNATIATAETTSSESQFQPLHAAEIIDSVATELFAVAEAYAGGPQDIAELETLLQVECQRFSRGNPPLLGFGDGRDERPYDVTVSFGADNTEADASVTILPYPVAETVNLNLTATDSFVQFGGAN
jgi:hypothetical protein